MYLNASHRLWSFWRAGRLPQKQWQRKLHPLFTCCLELLRTSFFPATQRCWLPRSLPPLCPGPPHVTAAPCGATQRCCSLSCHSSLGCPVPLQLLPSFHRPSPAHGHPLLPLLSSAPLDRFYRCCFFNHGLSAPPPRCTRSNYISTC